MRVEEPLYDSNLGDLVLQVGVKARPRGGFVVATKRRRS